MIHWKKENKKNCFTLVILNCPLAVRKESFRRLLLALFFFSHDFNSTWPLTYMQKYFRTYASVERTKFFTMTFGCLYNLHQYCISGATPSRDTVLSRCKIAVFISKSEVFSAGRKMQINFEGYKQLSHPI